MLEGEKAKSTVTAVEVKAMSSVGNVSASITATTVASTTAGHLAPIQQQPSGKPRRVRDELDPAPHHTAADIRVLEILKRIRDSGGVGDDDLDIPPPKRKSGRTKADRTVFTRQAPQPVLPQQQPMKTESAPVTVSAPTAKIPINPFKVPLSNRLDGIRIEPPTTTVTIPSQLKNGTPPSAILLASKNGTAVPVTASLIAASADGGGVKAATAIALLRQKSPVTTTGIGLELILPNGLRIPVSATCAKPEVKINSTRTVAPVTSTGGSPLSATVNQLVSIPSAAVSSTMTASTITPTTTTTTTASASQQMCSCSRSKCLKLYCDCFAAGKACGDGCNCRHCYNNLADDISKHTRDVAVRTALLRNPLAFKPKIENTGKHVLGCRCKRSHCLKGYCECYLNQVITSTSSTVIAGFGAATTAVASNATMASATIATTPSISSAVTTTPRTITLKVPIKALTPVNGSSGRVTRQVNSSPGLPPFIHQSYIAAVARSANPTQQDLLRCLRTVLPPIQPRPHPQPRHQTPLQSQTPQFVVQTPMTVGGSVDISTPQAAVPSSKLSPPFPAMTESEIMEEADGVTNGSTTLTPETSPPRDLIDDKGNRPDVGIGDEEEEVAGEVEEEEEDLVEDDNYSGYTEEELAFMQRLQQDRSTIAAPATEISQVTRAECVTDDTTATAVRDSSESPASVSEVSGVLQSSSVTTQQPGATASSAASRLSTLTQIRPSLQDSLPEIAMAPGRSILFRSEGGVHSAPPSLCLEPEERLSDNRCNNNVEVRFMRRKICELETQVSQLTQLIRTQGEMLGNLTDLLLSQQQLPQG